MTALCQEEFRVMFFLESMLISSQISTLDIFRFIQVMFNLFIKVMNN